MRYVVFFIVLHSGFVFKVLAQQTLNFDLIQKAQSAVFQIKTPANISGTGFFAVERDTFFTALHVLHEMMHFVESRLEDQVIFIQDGKTFPFRIKEVQAISALYDVAILKVEGYKGSPLQWEQQSPFVFPEEDQPFYTMGFLKQGFQVILSTLVYRHTDLSGFLTFSISSEHLIDGGSGGPVLNSSGKVVGMTKAGISREFNSNPPPAPLNFILKKIQQYKVSLMHFLSQTGNVNMQFQLIKLLFQNLKNKRIHSQNQWLFATPVESLMELAQLKPSSLAFSKQVELAFLDLEKQAHADDKFAQFYFSNFLVDQSQKMMSLLKNSSDVTHKKYMEEMKEKKKQGFKWLWLAAGQNLPVAQMSMAHLMEEDKSEYLNWMHRAAFQDYLPAQMHLAFYLLGENQDSVQGRKWLLKSALQDHREAQFYLALYTINNVQEVPLKNLQWLERSAAQGYSSAAVFLSMLLMVKTPPLTREDKQKIQTLLNRVIQQEYASFKPSLKKGFKKPFKIVKHSCQWLFSQR